jgi:hypothetical protein
MLIFGTKAGSGSDRFWVLPGKKTKPGTALLPPFFPIIILETRLSLFSRVHSKRAGASSAAVCGGAAPRAAGPATAPSLPPAAARLRARACGLYRVRPAR